jgi:hypothetical protein
MEKRKSFQYIRHFTTRLLYKTSNFSKISIEYFRNILTKYPKYSIL